MADSLEAIIDRLGGAMREHARVACNDGEPIEVIQAGDAVTQAARDYGEWLSASSGWGNPLGDIYADEDADEEDSVETAASDSEARTIVSVRAMYDYEIPDEALLIAAAQRLREETDSDARPVSHIGEAIYALIHGKGMTIPALEIPELVGLNGFTVVHQTTDPLVEDDLDFDKDFEQNLLPNDEDEMVYSFGDHRSC
ncbi:MAG: hypothetical protein Q8P61_09785 [Candidatus Nanopelagicales bacterium]|nr:hypothetical protein [Candidatus Nanopelagicales bacterium]